MLDFIWRQHDDEDTKAETVAEPVVSPTSADLEASLQPTKRPTGLLTPLHVGLALGLNIFVSLNTVKILIEEYLTDGYYPRLFIALAIPLQMAVSQVRRSLFLSFSRVEEGTDTLLLLDSSSVSSSSLSSCSSSALFSKCTLAIASTRASAHRG